MGGGAVSAYLIKNSKGEEEGKKSLSQTVQRTGWSSVGA